MDRVAIVGASAAGLAVAATLRDEGFAGTIALIGEERRPGYDRPPLSKKLHYQEGDFATLLLTDPAAFGRLDLDLRLGQRAVAADARRGTLSLADGATVPWDALVVATGVRPAILPGGGLTLRTFDDAIRLGEHLGSAEKVVIVGAGFLGCELAALVAASGRRAILVDPQPAPMADRFGPAVAARLFALHAARGVEMHFGVPVARILAEQAGPKDVDLTDGRRLEADLVVVAVGSRPATEWLAGSGIPVENGVTCDEYCRALPNVYAAGDVANWFNPRYARRMRIEHRMNATEQGVAVAANILGRDRAFDPIPYFWTDQFDQKIQVHGLIGGNRQVVELTGTIGTDSFVLAYVEAGLIAGVLGWNAPVGVRKARALVGKPPA
ncbi:MAG TPA: FAD/NAD(P)-binding oxidoreductase [Aliidongia sp.]|uniref:NAD(P)/FAD-dependent oxidoreductase n=1 Tax=Aliidongia sp. TaxID=1914230 RepID=UPI002DDD55A0|nr:FAD/NAD(P)-binding oxidoreductase [Aliidongia sp.]HEV2673779.1 FAD/NAD(P)-binding oxidoreductase [Aliidongia sp.]